jgi:uncharacterized membrane protein YjgN (DUF898 family)
MDELNTQLDKGSDTRRHTVPFKFTGDTYEYFRIWIVNVFLTLITLGIYSAWAKVRTKRYFYANTSVASSTFEYLANPKAILKGRLIVAFGVIIGTTIAYSVAGGVLWLFVGFLLAWPWLTVTTLRFNARNSAYRNIRFSFRGTTGQALATYFKGYLIVLVTLGIGYYYFAWMRHRFRVDNSRFGTSSFAFQLEKPKGYFGAYFAAAFFAGLVSSAAGLITSPVITAVSPDSIFFVLLLSLPGILTGLFYYAYLKVRFTNILFNNSRLAIAGHSFSSNLEVMPLFAIYLTNLIAIVLSVGFLIPWAMIRTARYRADNLMLIHTGDLTEFIGGQEEEISALGEEAGEFLDLDLGL